MRRSWTRWTSTRGGFPVDYGGRMSAVVDARSVDPAADGTYALGLSLYHLNALAGDTFAGDRGRWLASARRSNLAQVINLAESDLGEPRYVDAFLKAEYDLSDQHDAGGPRPVCGRPDRAQRLGRDGVRAGPPTATPTSGRRPSIAGPTSWLGRALLAWTTVGQRSQRARWTTPRASSRRRGRPAGLPQRAGQARARAGR